MRIFTIVLFFLLSYTFSYSQSTVANSKLEAQGSAALLLEGTNFNGNFMPNIGLRGGWTLNRNIFTGFDFNLLLPTATLDDVAEDPVVPIGISGGLVVEPIIAGNDMIHFTIPIALGGGGIFYFLDWSADDQDLESSDDDLRDGSFYGYFEPGVSLEVNVFARLRLGFGVSYRFTTKLDLDNTSADAFQGMNYAIIMKFGKY